MGKYLIEEPRGFALKPNIVLEGKFIVDTKWKIIRQDDKEKEKNKVSQADLYQLYAYSKKYECGKLYLIYPKIYGTQLEFPEFRYETICYLIFYTLI